MLEVIPYRSHTPIFTSTRPIIIQRQTFLARYETPTTWITAMSLTSSPTCATRSSRSIPSIPLRRILHAGLQPRRGLRPGHIWVLARPPAHLRLAARSRHDDVFYIHLLPPPNPFCHPKAESAVRTRTLL
jgi:hypothetical protein